MHIHIIIGVDRATLLCRWRFSNHDWRHFERVKELSIKSDSKSVPCDLRPSQRVRLLSDGASGYHTCSRPIPSEYL